MPITDITLRGISRATSDINTPDGATAELINAVVENNEIRPMGLVTTDPIDSEGTLLCIHSLGDGTKVYVFADINGQANTPAAYIRFKPVDAKGSVGTTEVFTIQGKYVGLQATTLGNVVVVSGAFGMYYFLYRDDHYENLGQRPPFPKLAFGMYDNRQYWRGETTLKLDRDTELTADESSLSKDGLRRVYEDAHAKISTFLGDCRKEGRFVFPFFVRYALRLFDGSGHILHSAPILMNPSTDKIPFSVPASLEFTTSMTYADWKVGFRGASSKLQFHSMCSLEDLTELKKWRDLVTHVDIFISPPIYSYKELTADYTPEVGEFEEWGCLRGIDAGNYGYFFGHNLDGSPNVIYETLYPEADPPTKEMVLPSYTQEEQYDNVKSTSLLYLVHSIPINEIEDFNTTTWEDVPIENEVLNSLETRQVLRDDFNSLVYKRGNTIEVYNQRLAIAGMGFQPYEGYPLSTMRPIINIDNFTAGMGSAVTLNKGRYTIVVNSETERFSNINKPQLSSRNFGFYYYPDTDAKSITIPVTIDRGVVYKTFDLTPHASLNGAYLFLGYPGAKTYFDSDNALPNPTENQYYSEPQTIYQSQVGNPFSFPLDGITSIGNAPLIALVASNIEVSTGQMGDYPMYAFTEEGIWVLSISKEGWISTPRLISHDVCLGRDAIVALNRPVVFASKRGLMLLEGSKISCLSDTLLGPRPDIEHILEDMKKVAKLDYHYTSLEKAKSEESFLDFLSGKVTGGGGLTAFFAYDYPNNRLLIMHPQKQYAYVLSLSSLEFSKVSLWGKVSRAINAYDGVYLQDDSEVMKLSKDVDTDGANAENVIIITRPIKFGSSALKTIKRMLLRHNCDDPSWVGIMPYGSRDGNTYYPITSLRGRSYKYFVFAILGKMKPSERLTALSFDWESRFTNKLR